jgi:fatty-acid desaturase
MIKVKLTHNQTVRGLQVINHLLSFIGIFWIIYTSQYFWIPVIILSWWFFGILGINVGYHRLISHRSFKTHKWVEYILGVIGIINTLGSPLAWVAIHRQHHRSTETKDDPHSPYFIGKINAWFGWWNLKSLDFKLIKDIKRDKFYKLTHKYYLEIIIAYCLILALINPWLIVYFYALPACLSLHASSSIIVIAHIHGYRTHETKDESRNSWIANLITMGEGWHNNHHAKPYAWNNQEQWWEWDIPALIIRLIRT